MVKRLLILAAALFLFQSLNAELDWNITGSGARAAGMGNAFIGVADDATAINWNPGGLTALEHFEMSVVGSSVFDIEEYKEEDNESYEYSEDLDYKHFNMNFLSMAYPLTVKEKKLVLAGAFQKQLDFYSENKRENYSYESEGGVYTANIGASYQILPYLSLGTTANIWMGSSEATQKEDYETYSAESKSKNKNFSGFNFVVGALFDMSTIKENVPLKLGLVVKTPFDLDYDYEYEYYESFGGTTETYESSSTVEMPLMFGLGASYRFGENFTFSVDFERRNYAKSKFIADYGDGEKYESDMSASKDDVNQFRIGMEYLIVTDAVVVPVRCGVFNYPTLWADTDYEWDSINSQYVEVDSEQLVGYGISVGSGLIFEKFAIDLSYNYLSYENVYNYDDLDGYEWSQTWTNSRSNLSFSAIVYLDSFMNK